jgi:hypothetical protein
MMTPFSGATGATMPRRTMLLLTLFPLMVQAQVYKWVDEKGKVQYGDRPVAKEIKNVPVLREAKQQTSVPQPGMKAEEVRRLYGEPERVQKTSTKSGVSLIWLYRKSKLSSQDFIVKIQDDEVVEVLTDTGEKAPPAPKTKQASPDDPAASDETRFAASGSDYSAAQEESARRAAIEKERRCAALRENIQQIQNQERRGGSAATMDNLREQKRKHDNQAWSQGC